MRNLRLASCVITALGLATIVLSIVADLGGTVLLAGILLAWAGIVKIVVVHLWTHVANLGSERHDPIHSP